MGITRYPMMTESCLFIANIHDPQKFYITKTDSTVKLLYVLSLIFIELSGALQAGTEEQVKNCSRVHILKFKQQN